MHVVAAVVTAVCWTSLPLLCAGAVYGTAFEGHIARINEVALLCYCTPDQRLVVAGVCPVAA